uniref:dolichyl-phosphate-mannose--protein mannosyltransferase n=1 Tax=Cacopsylla melanoneura TaxID=428564 RepID=A0A8D8X1R3_9HEMI
MDKGALFCPLVAFLIYYNNLDGDFVYDDSRAILTNPDVQLKTPVSELFNNDYWGTPITSPNSHGSYRPLTVLTFRLNYLMCGLKPNSFHMVNNLLHSAITYLVYQLSSYVLPNRKSRLFASLIFAVHPIHTEAVSGIVGRADLLCTLFYLSSILIYIKFLKLSGREQYKYNIKISILNKYNNIYCHQTAATYNLCCHEKDRCSLSCLFHIINSAEWTNLSGFKIHLLLTAFAGAAMISKETGVTVLLICICIELLHNKKSLLNLLSFSTSLLLLVLIRCYIMGHEMPTFAKADNPAAKHEHVLVRTMTFFYLPIVNFYLLLFPKWLSYDWSMESIPLIETITDYRNIFTALFYFSIFQMLQINLFNRKKCSTLNYKRTKFKYKYFYKNKYNPSNFNTSLVNKSNIYSKVEVFNKRDRHSIKNCNVHASNTIDNNETSVKLNNYRLRSDTKLGVNNYNESVVNNKLYTNRRTLSERRHFELFDRECDKLILCLLLMTVPFIPATNLFFYVGFVVAERLLYIPSIGFCYLISYGMFLLENRLFYQNVKLSKSIMTFMIIIYSFRTLQRNNDWKNDESLYRSGIAVNPPKSYGNLGSILTSQGRLKEAEWSLKKALQYRPNMAEVHYNLGLLLQTSDRYKEAIDSYKMAIHYRPSLAVAYLNLGQLLLSSGHHREGEDVLLQCSDLDGRRVKDKLAHLHAQTSAMVQLGKFFTEQAKFEKARGLFQKAVNNLPQHYPAQGLYNMLGDVLMKLNQTEEAEAWFKEALNTKPDHVPAYLTYGQLLSKNRTRVNEAEKWFLKAEKLAPSDPVVQHHLGQFLSENERYKEAADRFTKAVELAPAEYQLLEKAATALRHAGKSVQAELMYKRAVSLRPNDSRSHSNLGAILHLNGRYMEAAKSYEEALRIEPGERTTLSNLKKLHKVMSRS